MCGIQRGVALRRADSAANRWLRQRKRSATRKDGQRPGAQEESQHRGCKKIRTGRAGARPAEAACRATGTWVRAVDMGLSAYGAARGGQGSKRSYGQEAEPKWGKPESGQKRGKLRRNEGKGGRNTEARARRAEKTKAGEGE